MNRFNQTHNFTKGAVIVVILIALVASIIYAVAYSTSRSTAENCVVTDKDRSISVESDGEGNVSSKTNHRVYSSCGVFTVDDAWWLGKFNSSDTYSQIEVGGTYNFDKIGFRNGFFSMFPNILEAQRVAI